MGFKILIVEDSRTSREFIAATVESVPDVEAIATSSGFEALKLLPRHRFDLIITEINMPDINGLELINFVKKNPNYKDTPLFIITTEGREQDRDRGMALGAAEYLVKPFQPQSLEGLVRRAPDYVDALQLLGDDYTSRGRIREGLRAGKGIKQAVQLGYDKVFWTIVDAHVTTLAAAVVLMNYGTGPVRGFAVTLIIGLLASMFTSIVVTRAMMEYFTRHETARLSV